MRVPVKITLLIVGLLIMAYLTGSTKLLKDANGKLLTSAGSYTMPAFPPAWFGDTWTKDASNPVMTKGAAGAWDSLGVRGSGVVYWVTTAINRITLQPDGYTTEQFAAGSYLQIIGIKTAPQHV